MREGVASALGSLGIADDRVISALLGALEDVDLRLENVDVRDEAYSSLQKLAEREAREKSSIFIFQLLRHQLIPSRKARRELTQSTQRENKVLKIID